MLQLLIAPAVALAMSSSTAPADTNPTVVREWLVPPPVPRFRSLSLMDSAPARKQATDYGDAYYMRLTIHRYGSYAMLPLFGAEYLLGQTLLDGSGEDGWVKPTHVGVASAIGALFTINTVTGLWNLWDSRKDPNGRKLRIAHTVLLLAADAGFAITPLVVDDDDEGFGGSDPRTLHRNFAIGSMAIATLGTAIMWLRKD